MSEEGIAMGSEREQIVKFLRDEQDMRFRLATDSASPDAKHYNHTRGIAIAMAADAIEVGDHLPTERTDNGGQHE
jgi:hypothetical protein